MEGVPTVLILPSACKNAGKHNAQRDDQNHQLANNKVGKELAKTFILLPVFKPRMLDSRSRVITTSLQEKLPFL